MIIILHKNPTTNLIEKKIKSFRHKKTTTTKTIKEILKNNFKNTYSLYNAGVNKIRCQNCNKFYIRETSRNLNKRIYEHIKDFKTIVPHNILTNNTLVFRNSAIFDFIYEKEE